MRGCKASPLRDPRRERRMRRPDYRPRVRLTEPPRQESGAGLSACHRAQKPERPRSLRVDGCQRVLSPRTVATPVGRNRQPTPRQGDGLHRSALSQRVRGPGAMTLLHRIDLMARSRTGEPRRAGSRISVECSNHPRVAPSSRSTRAHKHFDGSPLWRVQTTPAGSHRVHHHRSTFQCRPPMEWRSRL